MFERPTTIAAGECFYSPIDGMDHYYQQREEFVLHINTDASLINRLDKNFLRDYPESSLRIWHQIAKEHFVACAQMVLQSWQLPIHVQVPISSN